MVLRCAWGTCNTDERYPDRLIGVKFFRFPNPRHELAKCLRWIDACCRPYEQLNVTRLNKHKAICSKHFYGGYGPTNEFPDPFRADWVPWQIPVVPVVSPVPLKRPATSDGHNPTNKTRKVIVTYERKPSSVVSTQTEGSWIEPIDALAITAENEELKKELARQTAEIEHLKSLVQQKDDILQEQAEHLNKSQTLSVNIVQQQDSGGKNLFMFYTGMTFVRFVSLLSFLVPCSQQIDYKRKRKDLTNFSNGDGLFLTLCRLKHGFELKDIATRFGLSVRSVDIVFCTWLDCMYYKLGQLSIWPHRSAIIDMMPEEYKSDYPTSLITIGRAEVKTQVPKAMQAQNGQSSSTLKCLIGCDPRGNLMYVSELFSGSITNKALMEGSGFYTTLQVLKSHGYVADGDGVVADEAFNVEKELVELGLKLTRSPSAQTMDQLPPGERGSQNMDKLPINRLIRRVKSYKIVSNRVPTSLYQKTNKIWAVCCLLTLFQDVNMKNHVK